MMKDFLWENYDFRSFFTLRLEKNCYLGGIMTSNSYLM